EALFEPAARRSFADDQYGRRNATPAAELVDRVGENVEALFHHQAPEEADRYRIVGDAMRTAPGEIAPLGREDLAVDAALPQRDVVVHALRAQHLDQPRRRRHQRVALAVELADPSLARLLQEAEVIIAPVCLEPRV